MNPSHLGDRLSAFIDGELGHRDRERVLGHLTRCAECRAAVEEERGLKSRLSHLSQPEPPAALLERLRGLPAPGPDLDTRLPATTSRRMSSPARRPGAAAPVRGTVRGPRRGPRPLGQTRLRRAALGTSALVAAALSTAFAIGGTEPTGTPVRPQVDRFTVEHASVSGTVPLVDPASLVGAGAP